MKLFISGYGKMGKMIEKIILSKGLDYAGWSEAVTETDPALAKECVCIDFTTPAAFRANYRFLAENFKAVVVGTTGWADIKEEVIAYFEKCGTPMVWASNFSIGVNVFFAVTDYISKMFGTLGGYSPYMIEMHHCHKLDAPSGTARSLADIVDANMDVKTDIQSVRCGEIPGIHMRLFHVRALLQEQLRLRSAPRGLKAYTNLRKFYGYDRYRIERLWNGAYYSIL